MMTLNVTFPKMTEVTAGSVVWAMALRAGAGHEKYPYGGPHVSFHLWKALFAKGPAPHVVEFCKVSIELAPSILSADFARLGEQVRSAGEGGGSVIHVDIMDGHFVPNLTLGPPVVKSLRQATPLPLDCHLMIENPDDFIPAFAEAGANWMSVHQEACRHLNRTLHLIQSHGCRAGVVINPATPVGAIDEVLDFVDYVLVMSVNPGFGAQKFIPSTLHKMRRLAEIRSQRGLNFRIEVDGGVAHDTVSDVVRAGGEILVAGNAVFGNGDPSKNAQELLQAANEAAMIRV